MASSLLSLSDDLVGNIFKLLPKVDGQISGKSAFSSCCKQVHDACSKQLSMLTISEDQLESIATNSSISSGSSSSRNNPFLSFPRNAQLKKLVLRGGPGASSPGLRSSDALVRLLQPTKTNARLRVMSALRNLEEVFFEGFLLKSTASATVGIELSFHSQLRVAEIVAHGDHFAPLLAAFAAPGAKGSLQKLYFTLESPCNDQGAGESIKAISKLGSLHTLSLKFPGFEDWGQNLGRRLPLSLISSLSQLTSLTIGMAPFRTLEEQSSLCSFLEHMPRLQKLSLPSLPREPVLAILPRTIETLVDNGSLGNGSDSAGFDMDHFCCATLDIAACISHLPDLRTIHVCSMTCGGIGMSENRHKFANISHALSALSHLHFGLENANGLDCFESFLDFCHHAPALARSITHAEFLTNGDEKISGSSEAKWRDLRDLCPALRCLEISCGCKDSCWLGLDLVSIHGVRQLSSLQELHLVNRCKELKPGDLRGSAPKLLALAVVMSAKEGLPLTIMVKFKAERDELDEEEIDQVQRECTSVSKALKGLNREHCDVNWQMEASE